MNVLFIGDPHIQTSNLSECEMLFERLCELARDRSPEFIVIGGDLLHHHERLHTTAMNKAYELVNLMRLIAPTFVLVGNHDYINHQQFLTENHWMNALKEWDNTTIVDQVVTHISKGFKFLFVPYVPNGRFIEALETTNADWKDASCIFAHQEFKGCKMGPIVSEDGDEWFDTFPNIVSGHIHSRQLVGNNIYYPGAAMQHAFGESETNIIPMLTFNKNGTYVREETDFKLPRKKIVYVDVKECEQIKVPDSTDTVRLSVSGTLEQFKALKKTKKYKTLVEHGVKIVFKPIEKDSVMEEISDSKPVDDQFSTLIHKRVMDSENPYIVQAFQSVFYDKDVPSEDILFLS